MYGYYESLILNAINNISNGSYKVVNINDLVVSVGLSKTDFNIVLLAIEYLNENGFISAGLLSGKDSMVVSVFGNEDRIILAARYDNLGKGASGAAIQNMNILMGVDETTGLIY